MIDIHDTNQNFEAQHTENSSLQAHNSLASEYLDSITQLGLKFLRSAKSEVVQGALSLFDGDRPLEIDHKAKEKPKQDWLIVHNLATDFGNECSIEARTKKLQELAADTANKPVTILVQAAVKDGDTGKYKLERFALQNGEIVKLDSPGNSNGYGADVEDLLKFANKKFPTNNIGLVLDSHGIGNGGMSGDVGDMSLTQLREAVERGLKGSGREKLDLLQFDACLMAQNGVLESTQGIARHIVASAEPEGTGTAGRDFDNRVYRDLLAKPTMTASELADAAVSRAREFREDFPTLAHFDMERYANFRKSLDSFGEGLAKLCKDPENLKVIQDIIKETYSYGGGGFSFFDIFKPFGILPGEQGQPVKPSVESFLQSIMKPTKETSSAADGFLSSFSRKSCDGGKRDIKDFVARVLLAISKGQIKDEDGSLREAGKGVLKEGTLLIKSFFGDGEARKNLGGLSAFLPSCPNDGGSYDPVISTAGGWRQFQNILRNGLQPAKR